MVLTLWFLSPGDGHMALMVVISGTTCHTRQVPQGWELGAELQGVKDLAQRST